MKELDVAYIYSMSRDTNGNWFFVMDGGNYQEDPEDDTFLESYDIDDEVLIAVEDKTIKITEGYYTDEWSTFKSAFYPVFNSNGKLITIVGADIEASFTEGLKSRGM